ncbi:transcription/translation regulatory transformer protein RfaH [Chloroflexota bacterium]
MVLKLKLKQWLPDQVQKMGERIMHWYVLRSKPNRETLLWEQLNIRKVETYYPQIRVQTVNPRARKIKAYFPGYVFVHVDLEQVALSTLQWMPGAIGFVSFGSQPSLVPDALIHAIRKRVDEINAAGGEIFRGLKQGDRVEIQSGPFAGCEAIFDARLPGSERVRILLKLLHGRATKMEVPAGLLVRKMIKTKKR